MRAEFHEVASPLVKTLSEANRAAAKKAADHEIEARGLEAEYKKALGARMEAEFRMREFVEGLAKQDLAVARGALQLAQDELTGSREALEKLKALRRRVSDALVAEGTSDKSSGLLTIWRLDGDVERAQVAVQRSELNLELEKSKLDLMSKHTIPTREKELTAELEKRRLEEQARREDRDRFQVREAQPVRGAAASEIPPEGRRLLDLLAEATRWDGPQPPWERGEAELRAFLDGFETKLDEARRLASQLQKQRGADQFLELVKTIRELGQPARQP